MKTERRHELEKNQLADWLGHKLTWAEQNASLLVGCVVAVVVIVGVVIYYQNSRAERSLSAWNTYFDAVEKREPAAMAEGLETVAKNDAAILPGQMAEILLADIAMNEGIDQLNTDREAGEKRLNEAKNRYVAARDAADDARIRERAVLGLARFYETMGLFDEAIKEYKSLADDETGLYRADAARKLELLGKPATIEFAKLYRERKPAPKPSGTRMFDLGELDKLPHGEASFPGTTGVTPSASATAAPAAASPTATPTTSATPTATKPAAAASPTATAK